MVARVAENVVIVSNRGPLAFSHDADGNLLAVRGAGGVASSLAPLVRDSGASWMAAAMTDADREAAAAGTVDADGFRFRMLAVDPDAYRMAYDVVSNGTLWFLHHGLWELARRPHFDRRWREAWDAYRSVNHTFARAVIDEAPADAIVLVQDYHFALVGTWLAQERPDLKAVHFTHIPFCDPTALRILPDDVAGELLAGMASYTSCGFHARRWAQNFEACCQSLWGWSPSTFVSSLAPDHDDIDAVAESTESVAQGTALDEALDGRRLILRVDRIELSKNLLRGFLAYEELLRTRPEWRGHVVFAAFVYPSREGLPEYLTYRQEVETLAARINDHWGVPGWTPIVLDMSDNFPRSRRSQPRRQGGPTAQRPQRRAGPEPRGRRVGGARRRRPRGQSLRRGGHGRRPRRRPGHGRARARHARRRPAKAGDRPLTPRLARRPTGRGAFSPVAAYARQLRL
jgi:trehalose 6-phosphate synthase